MLTLPHMITGAALGSLIGDVPGQNVLAFAVGWGSHYVLDAVPHWEEWFGKAIHGYPSDTPLKDIPRSTIVSGVLDFVVAIILLVIYLNLFPEGQFYQNPVFWGALGGFFPDFIDNLPYLRNLMIKIPGVGAERSFHEKIHISEEARRRVPYLTGLFTQLLVLGLGLWLLL